MPFESDPLIFDPLIFGERVSHVLNHASDSLAPGKTLFNVKSAECLTLVDEAWLKKGVPEVGDSRAYVVDMGRVIGTAEETKVRIVVKSPGSNEITSAYPWEPK